MVLVEELDWQGRGNANRVIRKVTANKKKIKCCGLIPLGRGGVAVLPGWVAMSSLSPAFE